MRTATLAVAALLLAGSASAQGLPQPLLDAKTVVVVNDGVDQNIYDQLVTEVRAWNRMELVESQADVTLTISSQQKTVSNGGNGQVVGATTYRLTFKNDQAVLYSDSAKGCCSVKSMFRKTLEKLDKRMQ